MLMFDIYLLILKSAGICQRCQYRCSRRHTPGNVSVTTVSSRALFAGHDRLVPDRRWRAVTGYQCRCYLGRRSAPADPRSSAFRFASARVSAHAEHFSETYR